MAKRNAPGNNKTKKRQTNNKENFKKGYSHSAFNKNATSADNPDRKAPGKEGMYRDKATIKRLKMYTKKPRPQDKEVRPNKSTKIDGNRKYFGNTRTIDDKNLEKLRREYEAAKDTNRRTGILLKKHKIPVSLLSTKLKKTENNLLEPFDKTFGPKMNRTKPKMNVTSLEELAAESMKKMDVYDNEKDSEQIKIIKAAEDERDSPVEKYMKAGQSKRIYSELHKVMDSSDVLCMIVDARDPMGTRSVYVESFISKNCPHKHIVVVINKVDLVPTWVTAKWISYFSKLYPTIAFHASINNPFGKPALFQILRQFDVLHREKKHISVGFVGYPNVGKSSVINTLKKQACCRAAPVPGETKVWQYITLTKRIYLIDCPGVVYDSGDSDTNLVLKGVLRCEKIQDASLHIQGILDKVKRENIIKLYGVMEWTDSEDFIGQCAYKHGRLLKGGDPDLNTMSKMIITDWQRGRIPYFVIPDEFDLKKNKPEEEENVDEEDLEENLNTTTDETKNMDIELNETTETNEVSDKIENKKVEEDLTKVSRNSTKSKNLNKTFEINQLIELRGKNDFGMDSTFDKNKKQK
jgi:nuclear GTP-binding protein